MNLQHKDEAPHLDHRELYYAMLAEQDECVAETSLAFLGEQLDLASHLDSDLPQDPATLLAWIRNQAVSVSTQYQCYLNERRSGAPRRYFAGRAHALWFLQAVSPTKLVDGAWLSSTVAHWQDSRFRPLIQTYLEELGDGLESHNHVAIYQRLLDACGCTTRSDLPDAYYTQGAIQLSLGMHGSTMLPEMIGFNLGYEQLPLHLLITACELDELGIDPWYFTLHSTIDNADTGHAEKAVRALQSHWPHGGSTTDFHRRLCAGYQLNALGIGTLDAIDAFDLEQELVATLERKARIGASMHADHCRIAGKSISQWLVDPTRMRELLLALVKAGWIVRNRPAEESRFWQLLQGPGAPMFGVFNDYEQQLLREWIAGDACTDDRPPLSFRVRKSLRNNIPAPARQLESRPRPVLRDRFSRRREHADASAELRSLEDELRGCADQSAFLRRLLPLLQPPRHASAAGLMATRIFKQLLA